MLAKAKKWGHIDDVGPDTMGCFSPTILVRKGKPMESIGVIYLNEADMTPEILSHECTHAAFGALRGNPKKRLRFGEQVDAVEERLCKYQGLIFQTVLTWLHDIGYGFERNTEKDTCIK